MLTKWEKEQGYVEESFSMLLGHCNGKLEFPPVPLTMVFAIKDERYADAGPGSGNRLRAGVKGTGLREGWVDYAACLFWLRAEMWRCGLVTVRYRKNVDAILREASNTIFANTWRSPYSHGNPVRSSVCVPGTECD